MESKSRFSVVEKKIYHKLKKKKNPPRVTSERKDSETQQNCSAETEQYRLDCETKWSTKQLHLGSIRRNEY